MKITEKFKFYIKLLALNVIYIFYFVFILLIIYSIIAQISLFLELIKFSKSNLPYNAMSDFSNINIKIIILNSLMAIITFTIFSIFSLLICVMLSIFSIEREKIDNIFNKYVKLSLSVCLIIMIVSSFSTIQIAFIISVITLYTIINKVKIPYLNTFKITRFIKPIYINDKNKNKSNDSNK